MESFLGKETNRPAETNVAVVLHARFSADDESERTRRGSPSLERDADEDFGTEEAGIEAEFRQKLSGLRRLPRHARPLALKAARDARFLALRALKEKRDSLRRARRALRRMQMATPQ